VTSESRLMSTMRALRRHAARLALRLALPFHPRQPSFCVDQTIRFYFRVAPSLASAEKLSCSLSISCGEPSLHGAYCDELLSSHRIARGFASTAARRVCPGPCNQLAPLPPRPFVPPPPSISARATPNHQCPCRLAVTAGAPATTAAMVMKKLTGILSRGSSKLALFVPSRAFSLGACFWLCANVLS